VDRTFCQNSRIIASIATDAPAIDGGVHGGGKPRDGISINHFLIAYRVSD
jgi:hypothetical protein